MKSGVVFLFVVKIPFLPPLAKELGVQKET
jgi:hypothetical protein